MAGKRHVRNTRQESLTCKTATSLIAKYISADLDPNLELSFAAHLRVCPDCIAFLNTYKKSLELAKSFLSQDLPALNLEQVQRRVVRNFRKAKTGFAAS